MPPATMSEKDQFIQASDREFEITMKLLREVPAGKEDFKPAAKSRTTRELAWIFVMEEKVLEAVSKGTLALAGPPPPPPLPVSEIVAMYEKSHREMIETVKAAPEDLMSQTINFPAGPGKIMEMPKRNVFWMFLMDAVHHRGQLSVYLRMLDAKVPSIYGGSLDEPWM
jgi:uncharacterized damage-inducible protein DinB